MGRLLDSGKPQQPAASPAAKAQQVHLAGAVMERAAPLPHLPGQPELQKQSKKKKRKAQAAAAVSEQPVSPPAALPAPDSAGAAGTSSGGAAEQDVDIDQLFASKSGKKKRSRAGATPASALPHSGASTPATHQVSPSRRQGASSGGARASSGRPGRVAGSKDDLFGTAPKKQRRYDEEGLPIYTADELNVGKGGDSDLCPFDCECCF